MKTWLISIQQWKFYFPTRFCNSLLSCLGNKDDTFPPLFLIIIIIDAAAMSTINITAVIMPEINEWVQENKNKKQINDFV